MVITLGIKTPSLNDWYSGSHWNKRSALKKVWRDTVAVYCKNAQMKPFTKFPLKITTQPTYKDNRKRDTDNTITAAKLFIDAIKHLGLIPDDTPEYVGAIELLPPRLGSVSDMTYITIEEA